jgi:small GTP-binding protein
VAQKELNLGIVAHVDAGKTTLTERLLYEAGVIDVLGSVDAGTTQTDSLALERERGITIRSAVTSFALGDVHVNLIDTPGHPDFIAEVERVLGVLDGAVLVISAVEGVQPQTRVLMNALNRMRVPTLMFVNKIDRGGASSEKVLDAISERLTRTVVPMGVAHEQGGRAAYVTSGVRSAGGRSSGRRRNVSGGVCEQRIGPLRRLPPRSACCTDEAESRLSDLLRLGDYGCRRRRADGRDSRAIAGNRGR